MPAPELLLLHTPPARAAAQTLADGLEAAGLPTLVSAEMEALERQPPHTIVALILDAAGEVLDAAGEERVATVATWRREMAGRRAVALFVPGPALRRLPAAARGVHPLQLPFAADEMPEDALVRLVAALRAAPPRAADVLPPPLPDRAELDPISTTEEPAEEPGPADDVGSPREDSAPAARASRGQKILLASLVGVLALIVVTLGVGFGTGKLNRGMFYDKLTRPAEWVDRGRGLVADAERQLSLGIPKHARGLAWRAVRQYKRSKRSRIGPADEALWAREIAIAIDVFARAALQTRHAEQAAEATDEGIHLLTPLPDPGIALARLLRLRTVAGTHLNQPPGQGLSRLRIAHGLVADLAGDDAELERARLALVFGHLHALVGDLDAAERTFSEALTRARRLEGAALVAGRARLGLAATASAGGNNDDALEAGRAALVIALTEVQRSPRDRRLRWLVAGTKDVLGQVLGAVDEPSARRAYAALAAAASTMPADHAPAANMLRSIASDFAQDLSLLPDVAWPLSALVARANPDEPITVCNHAEVTLAAARPGSEVEAGLARCLDLSADAPVRLMAAHALTLVAATEAGEHDRARAAELALRDVLTRVAKGEPGWLFAGSRAAIERRGSPAAALLSQLLLALQQGVRPAVDTALDRLTLLRPEAPP